MIKKIVYLFVGAFMFINLGCWDDDGGSVGPCIHEYREAIFHITDVRDTVTNMQVSSFKISHLKINNHIQTGPFPGDQNYNTAWYSNEYYCNAPCGFGYEEGVYELTITADGYKEKTVTFNDVKYSVFKGGCPSYNDGGTRITIYLEKE